MRQKRQARTRITSTSSRGKRALSCSLTCVRARPSLFQPIVGSWSPPPNGRQAIELIASLLGGVPRSSPSFPAAYPAPCLYREAGPVTQWHAIYLRSMPLGSCWSPSFPAAYPTPSRSERLGCGHLSPNGGIRGTRSTDLKRRAAPCLLPPLDSMPVLSSPPPLMPTPHLHSGM